MGTLPCRLIFAPDDADKMHQHIANALGRACLGSDGEECPLVRLYSLGDSAAAAAETVVHVGGSYVALLLAQLLLLS